MKTDNETPTLFLARTFLLGAATIAAYLGYLGFGGAAFAGCDPGSSCAGVLASKWSTVFDFPVAALGAGLYLALFFLAPQVRASGGVLRSAALASMLGVLVSGLWFSGIQSLLLPDTCLWCTVSHLLGGGGALLLFFTASRESSGHGASLFADLRVAASCALVVLGAAFTAQAFGAENHGEPATGDFSASFGVGSDAHENFCKEPFREVRIHRGKIRIKLDRFPSIGSAAAEKAGVAILDYSSVLSRQLVGDLEKVSQAYGETFSFAVLPGFKNADQRKLHRCMLTLFRIDAQAHADLDRDLRSGRIPATEAALLNQISRRVGTSEFQYAYLNYQEVVERDLDLAALIVAENQKVAGAEGLPQVVIGSQVVLAARPDLASYAKMVETTFGLEVAPEKEHLFTGAPSPEMDLSQRFIDVGNVPMGETVHAKVPFLNTGGLPLKLSWLRMGKGCRAVNFPKNAIEPGETGEIAIRVAIPSKLGRIERQITVHTNANSLGETIKIVGNAVKG